MAKQFKINEILSEDERNPPGETTVESVAQALSHAFRASKNLIDCARLCGMTLREFKMTLVEYLKYNRPDYTFWENESNRHNE